MIATERARDVRARGPGGHPTIVCVDDEPLVNRALYRLLSREPYDVLLADTPAQALRYVRDYDIDLVIADQRMPDMSGVELLAEVRASSPLTRGLLLTAYPESVLADDPPAPPAPPLFAKPWDDQTLREGVRDILATHRRSAAAAVVQTVLVPVDGSIEPEFLLRSASSILGPGARRIVLLEVLPELGLHRDVYARLERMREELSSRGVDAVADVRWGDPAEQILLHARHADADLILLTVRDAVGGSAFFRKSLAEKILEQSDLPLLIGRPELTDRPWKRILVPLDGSSEAEAILPDAVRFAKNTGARIDVVGVRRRPSPMVYGYPVPPPPVPDRMPYLSKMAREVEDQEVAAEARLLEGDPSDQILQFARESNTDLLCMTSRARRGWAPRFFGASVSRAVLRGAPCPVFLRKA